MTIGDTPAQQAAGRRPFVVRALRALWRLATDRAYRNVMYARWFRPKAVFQPFNDTRPERYPPIFRCVQSRLGEDSAVRILSFGCSTGEEVLSLRRYFPRAFIKGIDVNPGNIAACIRRTRRSGDTRLVFETASSTAAEPAAAYDAIFCMAVLRHGGLTAESARCDGFIKFEDFATAVAEFDRCLKPGGLLVIVHSNFRFADTTTSANYKTVVQQGAPTPLVRFGSDNARVAPSDVEDVVFRKLR